MRPVTVIVAVCLLIFHTAVSARNPSGPLLELRVGPTVNTAQVAYLNYPFYMLDSRGTGSVCMSAAAGYNQQLFRHLNGSVAGLFDLYWGGNISVLSLEPRISYSRSAIRPFLSASFGRSLSNQPFLTGRGGRDGVGIEAEERIKKNALFWGANAGVHVKKLRFPGLIAGVRFVCAPTEVTVDAPNLLPGGDKTRRGRVYERNFQRIIMYVGVTL
jgi:hypothetical protein